MFVNQISLLGPHVQFSWHVDVSEFSNPSKDPINIKYLILHKIIAPKNYKINIKYVKRERERD